MRLAGTISLIFILTKYKLRKPLDKCVYKLYISRKFISMKEQYNFRLDKDEVEKFDVIAERKGTTRTGLIQQYIHRTVNKLRYKKLFK